MGDAFVTSDFTVRRAAGSPDETREQEMTRLESE